MMTILSAWSVLEGAPSSWHQADQTSEKTRDPNKLIGILQNLGSFRKQCMPRKMGWFRNLPVRVEFAERHAREEACCCDEAGRELRCIGTLEELEETSETA